MFALDLYGLAEIKLNEVKIPFQIVGHLPVLTTEQTGSNIEGIDLMVYEQNQCF